MRLSKATYKWLYDNIQSKYYNLLIKYCMLPFGGEAHCRNELIEPVNFKPKDKILDMCCGTGGVTYTIAQKAGPETEIIGMDLSDGQIRAAKKNSKYSNITFVARDVTKTTFEDNYFDKVFISHALHEMWREERLKVLTEAKRVVKDNAQVIVLELDIPSRFLSRWFAWFWLFYWLPFNPETPTKNEMFIYGLENEVREVGFKNVMKVNKFNGTFQTVIGEKSA